MDWIEGTNSEGVKRQYFACININTKYLYILPQNIDVTYTSMAAAECLMFIQNDLVHKFGPKAKIKYLRADGAKGFASIPIPDEIYKIPSSGIDYRKPSIRVGINPFIVSNLTQYLKSEGVALSTYSSPYTNKNRVIDRAIRTIRDRVGENMDLFFEPEIVISAVEEYNHTPHYSFNYEFTPFQVQSYPELEECFIRENLMKLDEVKKKQNIAGYFNYRKGNILLVHLDSSKLGYGGKKRRKFNRLAVFDSYVNGNVGCNVLIWNSDLELDLSSFRVTIPIYYTKLVAEDLKSVPNEFYKLII
jgi:hypothetical protein